MSDIQEFDPLQARRDEVAQYTANIAMYQTILATLPTVWPDNLLEHRHPKKAHEAIDQVPVEHVQTISELWYADELAHLIRTETLERTKAAAILAALEAQAK
jgi:hypothetical protein